jgi:hypothetical protein
MILSNCNPYPLYIYEVKTLEEEKWHYKGREIISKEKGGVEVIISFEDQYRYDLIFNFSIINRSDKIFEVDPMKMLLQIEKTYPGDYYKNKVIKLSPTNPEKQINKLRKQMQNTKVDKINTDAIFAFASLADIVKDFSEIERRKTTEELYQDYLISEERNQSAVLQNVSFQNSIRNLSETKFYWENYAFRKTTLFRGTEISGFVHFPLDESARELKIVVPINELEFSFRYSSRPLINRFNK